MTFARLRPEWETLIAEHIADQEAYYKILRAHGEEEEFIAHYRADLEENWAERRKRTLNIMEGRAERIAEEGV